MKNREKIRQVALLPYDPDWVVQFEKAAAEISGVLGENCRAIHHIGSTAIPDIYAKPIIDILVVVSNLSTVDTLNSNFEMLGYTCLGEYGIPGRRFYWKGQSKHTHHTHLFEQGNPRNHTPFRI